MEWRVKSFQPWILPELSRPGNFPSWSREYGLDSARPYRIYLRSVAILVNWSHSEVYLTQCMMQAKRRYETDNWSFGVPDASFKQYPTYDSEKVPDNTTSTKKCEISYKNFRYSALICFIQVYICIGYRTCSQVIGVSSAYCIDQTRPDRLRSSSSTTVLFDETPATFLLVRTWYQLAKDEENMFHSAEEKLIFVFIIKRNLDKGWSRYRIND